MVEIEGRGRCSLLRTHNAGTISAGKAVAVPLNVEP